MTRSTSDIDDVLVVGGGDVGLLTALSVRKVNSDLEVTVVDDFDSDPPDVGKSTYQRIVPLLHSFLEIPEDRFLSEVRPLWKASVYFRDWCGYDPFHYPFDDPVKYPGENTPDAVEQLSHHYHEVYDDPDRLTVNEAMVERGKCPVYYDPRGGGYSSYSDRAYHLDLARFNDFLRTLCEERGIDLVDDEITAVDTDGIRVEAVHGEDGYRADLYVDASGFNRVLKGELADRFRTFDLPLDSAVNAKVDRPLSDAVSATVVESGDHGWFWQIDTYDFRDVGYVYASDFVSDDDAAAEFLAHVDGDVSRGDLTRHRFRSGYFTRPWQGNCVAIGNAVGFVEPLQSTGLTANAQSAHKLANLLSAGGAVDPDGARDAYNAWVTRLWRSIYDFVSVHYRYSSGETPFWDAVSDVELSPRVHRLVEHFDRLGYDTTVDPAGTPVGNAGSHLGAAGGEAAEDLLVFPPISFFTVIRNMGAESSFYEENDIEVRTEVRESMDAFYDSMDDQVEQLLTPEEMYRGVLEWES